MQSGEVHRKRVSAAGLLRITLDQGSFRSWDLPLEQLPIEASYRGELAAAYAKAGTDESVITGEGTIDGRRVAVVVGEFAFLGGSIGVNAANRIVGAVRRATRERLPLLAAPISGGTRMQEGTVAFLQMVRITNAILSFKSEGLPYLAYLRDPTMGGVFASWASLGHITVAQTGATIGFLGPKVYRALYGEDFPADVQTAENLYRHGIVDAVLDPLKLRPMTSRVLSIIDSSTPSALPFVSTAIPTTSPSAWQSIELSRRAQRPGLRTLLRTISSSVVPLSGTGSGESTKSSMVALATIFGQGVVIVGFDRTAQHLRAELDAGALRQARRGMALAEDLRMPLVSVIDTPGAALTREAEEGGLGGEIARCIATLTRLAVPTVSVILGQGTGGAALALIPADRILCAGNGWLSPLPPEGASVIRYGTPTHAPEMANSQGVQSWQLLREGIVDEVIDERPAAHLEPSAFCQRVGNAIVRHITELTAIPSATRMMQRLERIDALGMTPVL